MVKRPAHVRLGVSLFAMMWVVLHAPIRPPIGADMGGILESALGAFSPAAVGSSSWADMQAQTHRNWPWSALP